MPQKPFYLAHNLLFLFSGNLRLWHQHSTLRETRYCITSVQREPAITQYLPHISSVGLTLTGLQVQGPVSEKWRRYINGYKRIGFVLKIGQRTQTEFLKVSRFQSIRTKIIVFALMATIVPTIILGWQSYRQNSKLLREKISHELRNATVQASGKLDLWLKERLYDLRVFSSSYIISENLARIPGRSHTNISNTAALDNIKAYLNSIENKFSVYESLILIDLSGKPLLADTPGMPASSLPEPWLNRLKKNPLLEATVKFPPYLDSRSMFIAEAVRASDGRPLGILSAKIEINAIRSILKNQASGGIDETYLLDSHNRFLVSSISHSHDFLDTHSENDEQIKIMDSLPMVPTDYMSHHQKQVVGMAVPITSMGWVMVAEMNKNNAYAEIVILQRYTVITVGGLVLSIGLLAYLFGYRLVRPLQRLSSEAASVAAGNLEVDIPVTGLSEVSYLTQVFNHMVASLRHNRNELSTAYNALKKSNEELHQLSITDGLTGLYNRKHIMDLFHQEMTRSARYDSPLSLLMLDIDHFKKVNDTYGHQAGDAVLCRLAQSLMDTLRDCDYAGRYGGEEFLILLPDSDIHSAQVTAERIRKQMDNLQFYEDQAPFTVTVSIGVAGYPTNGRTTDDLLGCADHALYQAKAEGRNRVVCAQEATCPPPGNVHPFKGAHAKSIRNA